MRWRRQQVGPIGVDIGTRRVRLLQLRPLEGSFQVVAASEADLPARADEGQIRSALSDALGAAGFIGRDVAVCLANSDLHVKNMRLPDMPEAELEAAAVFEAKERFSELPENAAIRLIPAGVVGGGSNQQQEVIVLAADPAAIETRLSILTKLGLNVVGIEPGACSFFRPFERFQQRATDAQEAHVLLDVGRSGSRIIITRGQDVVFLKSCPVGGDDMDEAVAKAMAMEKPEAAALRQSQLAMISSVTDSPLHQQVLDAVKPLLDRLGKEIGLCLRYYAVTFRGERPEQVLTGGDEAGLAGLIEYLTSAAGMPTVVGEAFRNIDCNGAFDRQDIDAGLPGWITALGLALRSKQQIGGKAKVA